MIRQWIRRLKPGHNTLGLEVTDTHAKLCELREWGNSVKVTQYAAARLPDGTMNDGKIQDEYALRRSLRKLLDEYKWSSRHVHFAVPSQSVMTRLLRVPKVSNKELKKIIDFEVEHQMHLPFDEPAYDYIKLGEMERGTGRADGPASPAGELSEPSVGVLLVIAPLAMLQQYDRLFKDLDLVACSMEIKAFSLYRLASRIDPSVKSSTTLLVDVNDTSCDLTIVQDGLIRITRNIPALFQTAANVAGSDDFFAHYVSSGVEEESSYNELASEIERLINFYRYSLQHRTSEVQNVFVSGDVQALPKFAAYLAGRLTGMKVSTARWPEVWRELDARWPQLWTDHEAWGLPAYAVPLGLGLRGKN